MAIHTPNTPAIMVAATMILQSALAAQSPGVVVQRGSVRGLTNDCHVYLIHRGTRDARKSQGWIRRTHTISIHLLLKLAGDEQECEDEFCALNDLVLAAFYAAHTVGGTAADCAIKQDDVGQPDGTFYLMLNNETSWRSRWYALQVEEDCTYAEQA